MKTNLSKTLCFSASRKVTFTVGAIAALSVSWSAHASLVGQWLGDGYTTGSWLDNTGNGHDGAPIGTVATSNVGFNGHQSLIFAGGDGAAATGFFTVPNNASTLIGATDLTLAAVFIPSAPNTSVGGQFWQKAGLLGNEQPGNVGDWGLGFGASQADLGVGLNDTTIVSGDLTLDQPHIAVGIWSSAGTMNLFVDGVQVAENLAVSTSPRDNNGTGAFALGSSIGIQNGDTHVFIGQIAELRAYNSVEDAGAIYSDLNNTYVVPEPASAALLALGGLALGVRRRRP